MIDFDFSSFRSASTTASRVSPWLIKIAYPLGRFFLLPFFFSRISVTGQENLPKTGPVILAPTHRSRWDALLVPHTTGRGVTQRDLRYMVSGNECRGIQGWFIKRLGGFAIDPKQPSITSLRHGVELLQNGEMLVIFPEGGIFRDNEVKALKPGLARLALSAESSHPGLGITVVPVGISYNEAYPSWGSRVSIHIGSPLKVADYQTDSPKQGAKRLTADLRSELSHLSGQESESRSEFVEVHNSGF